MVVAVAAAALALVLVLREIRGPRSARGPQKARTPAAGASVRSALTPAPRPARPAAAKPTPSELWPEPDPIPGVRATHDPNFGDPFESKERRPGDVRELTRVGAFRLGVTIESAVRDERAVIAVLNQLGAEIDALDRGRTDDYERRIMEYQSIIQSYRAKLSPYMDGAFAMKGNGWTDTERLVPPHVAPPHEDGVDD